MNLDDLEKSIENLKKILAKHHIEEIVGMAYLEGANVDWSNPQEMNLHSPFKECEYIISLALRCPQPVIPLSLDENAWKKICNKTNEIFLYYGMMNLPKEDDTIEKFNEVAEKGSVAATSFMFNLCSGVYGTVEQIYNNILNLFSPHHQVLEQKLGFNARDAVNTAKLIQKAWEDRRDNGPLKMAEHYRQFKRDLEQGLDPFVALENSEIDIDVLKNIQKFGSVSKSRILSRVSSPAKKKRAAVFLDALTCERENIEDTLYPTEDLIISKQPLVKINNDDLLIINMNFIAWGIYNTLYECMINSDSHTAFNKHKGQFLEKNVQKCLQDLLGEEAKIYTQVFETNKNNNEHDIVVLIEGCLIIVECKAKRIRKNFRDIVKAYKRIRSDFKSYIQEGYNQARKLEKLILSQDITLLYDNKGRECLSIKRSEITSIEKIVATYENEGLLAVRPSLLLEVEDEDFPPICLNLENLKQLSEFRNQVGMTPHKFINYLKGRKLIHEKVASDDELDIVGYFLDEGSFNDILKSKSDIYTFDLAYSKRFDDAYMSMT